MRGAARSGRTKVVKCLRLNWRRPHDQHRNTKWLSFIIIVGGWCVVERLFAVFSVCINSNTCVHATRSHRRRSPTWHDDTHALWLHAHSARSTHRVAKCIRHCMPIWVHSLMHLSGYARIRLHRIFIVVRVPFEMKFPFVSGSQRSCAFEEIAFLSLRQTIFDVVRPISKVLTARARASFAFIKSFQFIIKCKLGNGSDSIQFPSSFTIRRHLTVFVFIQCCCDATKLLFHTKKKQKTKLIVFSVATLLLHLLLLCERVFPLLQFSATHQAFERTLNSQYADIAPNTGSVAARSSSSNTFYKIYFPRIKIITQFLMPFVVVAVELFGSHREFSLRAKSLLQSATVANASSILISCSDSGRIIHFNFCIQRIRSVWVRAPCYRLKQYCNRISYKLNLSLYLRLWAAARCCCFSRSFALFRFCLLHFVFIIFYLQLKSEICWNPWPAKHEMNVLVLWAVCVCVCECGSAEAVGTYGAQA